MERRWSSGCAGSDTGARAGGAHVDTGAFNPHVPPPPKSCCTSHIRTSVLQQLVLVCECLYMLLSERLWVAAGVLHMTASACALTRMLLMPLCLAGAEAARPLHRRGGQAQESQGYRAQGASRLNPCNRLTCGPWFTVLMGSLVSTCWVYMLLKSAVLHTRLSKLIGGPWGSAPEAGQGS